MRALVRHPSPRLAEGIVTHFERQPVNYELAVRQWHVYVETLRNHGWEIIEVPPADDCPDSVFIEDTLLMYKQVAIVSLPGADQRKPETAAAANIVHALGYQVERIEHPGTFDGGDALKVGNTIYVGHSARTNANGIEQLRAILSPHGATVIAVPLTKVLHLKSAITALPDQTIIGWLPAIDDVALFPTFIAVPEESGAHVVLIGANKLLMSSGCPRTATMFRELGYEPVEVDIDEFIKLEGCVTCLSVRLRDAP